VRASSIVGFKRWRVVAPAGFVQTGPRGFREVFEVIEVQARTKSEARARAKMALGHPVRLPVGSELMLQ